MTQVSDFIEHYGKQGMRWGSRKTTANKILKKKKTDKPKAKDLSDEELRTAVNRMNLEKQYTSLTNGSSNKTGAKFVKNIGSTAVKTALTAVATQQVNSALKKAKIAK